MAHPESTNVCIVCGPSGVGKGTMLNNVKKCLTNTFAVAVSHTTRKPRQGEVDGMDYHFITRTQFEQGINNGEFVEYADVHGNYYGTSIRSIQAVHAQNLICILEIDVQGAKIIREDAKISANYLFITCEGGIDTLRARLMGRNSESQHQIKKRLHTAQQELTFLSQHPKFFECVLSNDNLEQSTQRLIQQFKAWYPSIIANQSTDDMKQNLTIESCPLVVCGPSGVGKGTLLQRVKALLPNTFGVACSHTTRTPRQGEMDGVHYNFTTKEAFEKSIASDEFVEYAEVNGNYYGTSYDGVRQQAKKNLICILEIDVQGAEIIQTAGKLKAHYLFITCDGGMDTLKKRLLGRNTENAQQIEKRLNTAQKELRFLEAKKDFFGCVLSNDDLEDSVHKLIRQLKAWYPWLVTDNLGTRNDDEKKSNLVMERRSADGLFNALQFDGATIYDVRCKGDYDALHAFGAIHVPTANVVDQWKTLPTQRIFVYGDNTAKMKRLYALASKLNVIQFCVIEDSFDTFKNVYPFLCVPRADNHSKMDQNRTRYPNCVGNTSYRLYIGGEAHAFDANVIHHLGITHIVNTKGTPSKLDETIAKTIRYLNVKIEDSSDQSPLAFFDECAAFVDGALKENDANRVLIHCGKGKSRSSTFTIAYLMKHKNYSLAFAYGIVSVARPKAFPNDGFLNDLAKYEAKVLQKSTKHFIANSKLRDKAQWKKVLASWKIDL